MGTLIQLNSNEFVLILEDSLLHGSVEDMMKYLMDCGLTLSEVAQVLDTDDLIEKEATHLLRRVA